MKSVKMMMAAILLCGTMCAQAQDYYETKHEIGVSIGWGATSQILNSMVDFTSTGITGGAVTYDNESNFPAISLEYFYHVSPLIGVGGFIGYSGRTEDILVGGSKGGEAKRHTFSLVPTVKFDWLRKKSFGMYSKLGVGVSMMSDKQKNNSGSELSSESTYHMNFQASLVGMEFGSEYFRGFAELGFGQQGILLAGVKYKF